MAMRGSPDELFYRRQARTYAWDRHEYDTLFKKQKGVCLICQQAPRPGRRLCTDHDHSPGLGRTGDRGPIRALLCDRCNRVLGQVRDNPALLIWMARYLVAKDSADEWVPTALPALRDIPAEVVRAIFTVPMVGGDEDEEEADSHGSRNN